MSLKIIYGKAKSGKSEYCFSYIDDIVENTKDNVLYIVPAQYSLQAEREISKRFKSRAMDRVEVLSLERLAGRVFSNVGPVICNYVDDNVKLMVIEKILLKLRTKLTYFKNSYDTYGFSSVMLELFKTFKQNLIDAEFLLKSAESISENSLKFKLYDIALIFDEYNKFFLSDYYDSDDDLSRLAEKIEEFSLFSDTHIIFENFVSFTKSQLGVLYALLRVCPTVTVSLNADDLSYNGKFDLFYRSKQTAQILFSYAYENGIDVLPNTYLDKDFYKNEELSFLCNNYFGNQNVSYDEKTKNLFILKSSNFNKEIEQIAGIINRLVRKDGLRYRDIAVVTNSGDTYYPIISDVFSRYKIFYNISSPVVSDSTYLYTALLSVFTIFSEDYSFNSIFDFVKSPLCDLSDKDKYLLENYVVETGNTKKLWESDYEITFKASFNDYEFSAIKKSFDYVRKCLSVFKDNFKGRKKVSQIISAYSQFLKYTNAESVVKGLIKDFKQKNEFDLAQQTIMVYNHVINSLSQMNTFFGDEYVTFEKFIKILKSAMSNDDIYTIPSGVDDVLVTSVDRFLSTDKKVVFVVGVTDGAIPTGYINEGVLKDFELKTIGIEDDVLSKHCDELYKIYRMFSSASEKLYLSYPMSDNESKAVCPSAVISDVKRMFKNITVISNVYKNQNPMLDVEGVIPTFNKAVLNGENGFWETVFRWYEKNRPDLYEILKNSKEYKNTAHSLSYDTVKKLYGENINSSISRIEKYNQCAFSYFIRYGLNVDERKTFDIQPSDYGTYMHEIIEKYTLIAKEYPWENVTKDICDNLADKITRDVLNDKLSDFYTDSNRYSYLFNKIISIMKTVLWNITGFYNESEYVNLGCEIEFSDDGRFSPIEIELSDGTLVKLRGKIDRADIMYTDDGNFVSIVDYKSGNKDVEYDKILCGVQIQLPIYIKAVCQNISKTENNIIPAAMFYYHIDEPIVSGDTDMSDEDIKKEIVKKLKMKGISIESSKMPYSYAVKPDITAKQIEKICNIAYGKAKNALENMISGDISINPKRFGDKTACDFCPYGNICNFDTTLGSKYMNYRKLKKEEFFEYAD